MSRLYSPIGRRHRVATSALVGAIAIFLSAAAAPAETTYSAASGVETVAQAPVTSSPGAAAATATAADSSIRPVPCPCVRRSAGGPPPADRRDKVA
jgi:hypothetical protein